MLIVLKHHTRTNYIYIYIYFFSPVFQVNASKLCNFIMESLIFFDHLLHMNTQPLHLLLWQTDTSGLTSRTYISFKLETAKQKHRRDLPTLLSPLYQELRILLVSSTPSLIVTTSGCTSVPVSAITPVKLLLSSVLLSTVSSLATGNLFFPKDRKLFRFLFVWYQQKKKENRKNPFFKRALIYSSSNIFSFSSLTVEKMFYHEKRICLCRWRISTLLHFTKFTTSSFF